MAREFVETIDISATGATVTGAETTVYTFSVTGGTLQTMNSLLLLVQARIVLAVAAAVVTVKLKYGGTLIAEATLKLDADIIVGGWVIEGLLSADGSANLQLMHLNNTIETPPANIAGVPLGFASGSIDSASDQNLVLTFTVANGGSSGVQVTYAPTNTGNGVFAATPTLGGSAEDGDYVLVCTAAAANAGTFSVTSPSGASLSALTVGVAYSGAHINGTLNDGSADFIVGDTITVTVGVSSKAIFQHAVLKKISFIEDPEIPTPELPNTQVLTISKLTLLPHSLFKDVRFYGEFLHHLDHSGVGTAVVARASAQNATWRDGAAHSVAANLPRFEYSGDTPLGLLINSGASETLTIAGNNLHDANTIFWRENNVTKYTTVNTNPFNSSGVWTGTDNIHISHVLKFSRVLTATEIAIVLSILDS